MEPANYSDPLEDALSHGSQRLAQIASLLGAASQVLLQHRALHNARQALRQDPHADRVLAAQERLLGEQAQLAWAPAHDPQWLAHADIIQTARAWAATTTTRAATDPTAAAAMRLCEERLRALHPYAMAHYDWLRAQGLDPLDAMTQAAPLFARAPTPRPGDPAPARHSLTASAAQTDDPADVAALEVPDGLEPAQDEADLAEQRGRLIIDRLQNRARAAGRDDIPPSELAMVLDATTNLPTSVIDKLTQHGDAAGPTEEAGRQAATAHTPRSATTLSAAQLAGQSFPHTVTETVQAAARKATRTTAAAARTRAPHQTQRARRSL